MDIGATTTENQPLHLAMKELTLKNIGPYADLTVGFDATGLRLLMVRLGLVNPPFLKACSLR